MVYYKKKTIVFDFDGVIHSGYRGFRYKNLEDLKEFIKEEM